MKWVMVVLAIHFIGEMISNKRKKIKDKGMNERNEIVVHPAEYLLR